MEKFYVQQQNGAILDLTEYSWIGVRKYSTDEKDKQHEVAVYKRGDSTPLLLGVFKTRAAAQWAVDQIMIRLEKCGIGFSLDFCQHSIPIELEFEDDEEEK